MLHTGIRLCCGHVGPNYHLNIALTVLVPVVDVGARVLALLSVTPAKAQGERFAEILVYRGDNIVESPGATKQPI